MIYPYIAPTGRTFCEYNTGYQHIAPTGRVLCEYNAGGRSDYYIPLHTIITREATGTPPLTVMPVEE